MKETMERVVTEERMESGSNWSEELATSGNQFGPGDRVRCSDPGSETGEAKMIP